MTDRHRAGEDADVPGLDKIYEESDPADPDAADELLEGLLGAQAAKREDVPTAEDIEADSDEDKSSSESPVEDTPTGR